MKSSLNKEGPVSDAEELRCCCGRLLAVRVAAGYEIRCSRCKSVMLLPLGRDGSPPEDAGETRG